MTFPNGLLYSPVYHIYNSPQVPKPNTDEEEPKDDEEASRLIAEKPKDGTYLHTAVYTVVQARY